MESRMLKAYISKLKPNLMQFQPLKYVTFNQSKFADRLLLFPLGGLPCLKQYILC